MAARRGSPRQQRRAETRRTRKLREDLEHLARLEVGGSPENPIEIASPAQVDARAEATACPLCEARLKLDEHTAATIGEERLRLAACRCTGCGVPRTLYFRLRSPLLS